MNNTSYGLLERTIAGWGLADIAGYISLLVTLCNTKAKDQKEREIKSISYTPPVKIILMLRDKYHVYELNREEREEFESKLIEKT